MIAVLAPHPIHFLLTSGVPIAVDEPPPQTSPNIIPFIRRSTPVRVCNETRKQYSPSAPYRLKALALLVMSQPTKHLNFKLNEKGTQI